MQTLSHCHVTADIAHEFRFCSALQTPDERPCTNMTQLVKQFKITIPFWVVFVLVAVLGYGFTTASDCSGRFALEDSTVKLLIQQYVNSTESVVECRFVFEGPQDSGFLLFANDITAVNDAEIPGCPAVIYDNADASGSPVFSLCGHYSTQTIPVISPTRPSRLQARLSRQIHGSGDAEEFCDLKVTGLSHGQTLGTECILTSDGVCRYDVLLSNGSVAESPNSVDLDAVGGEAVVRLFPAGITGVLIARVPSGFEAVTSLDPPLLPSTEAPDSSLATVGTNSGGEALTQDSANASVTAAAGTLMDETDGPVVESTSEESAQSGATSSTNTAVECSDVDTEVNPENHDSKPTIWQRMGDWFSNAWTTVKNGVCSAVNTVKNWFKNLF
ncbi:hypothetical protein HPB48_022688 [Haemaphysalis longicornis]|uniref:Uncharacterized protein n=1 Tax=Haemaphysalis longicornis TaxID=44386 RepID=A0A9J6GEC8_HAELO|nr:hypothetical protein HPB48_022688 [Haemaphysalis longicornis]